MRESYNVKISIVIPVYNGQDVIEKTVKKILDTTHHQIEVILVDDGSVDKSVQVCKELENTDSRVRVYTKENGGVASARNYGVSRATGDFLCFCDQDDVIEKEMFHRMLKKIIDDDSDICMCSTARSINGKVSVFEQAQDACYKDGEILEYLIYPLIFNGYNVSINKSNVRRYPHIWNCMFRKSFWDAYQFQFRIYVQYEDDLLMKLDTLTRAKKVSTIAYIGYLWNVNMNSETYAHKYIEKIATKQELCYEDMERSLVRCVDDKTVLELFRKTFVCKQYMEAIHNLSSPRQKKNIAFIKKYFQDTIYSRDFEKCITGKAHIAKGQIKANVLLPLLSHKCSILCYIGEKILDIILVITLRSQFLTKIERRIKGVN